MAQSRGGMKGTMKGGGRKSERLYRAGVSGSGRGTRTVAQRPAYKARLARAGEA